MKEGELPFHPRYLPRWVYHWGSTSRAAAYRGWSSACRVRRRRCGRRRRRDRATGREGGNEGEGTEESGRGFRPLALFGGDAAVNGDLRHCLRTLGHGGRGGRREVGSRDSTKALARALSVAQVGLLALCGYSAGIGSVDLKRPERWFHKQFWIVGVAFVAGFVGECVR
ncbi:hypothetical protein F4820DRAFT_142177 [Hypoxylon rubiginosum]|uniref:Uncharacterized protein n=1 Tax=Hypoxylon rubiginosum TaxID=110542 RepID=A0ACB9YLA8_9PEZI|nr:hypothetical protein F4820DRAFT_142177 [Hypoxylon rubiginosum]